MAPFSLAPLHQIMLAKVKHDHDLKRFIIVFMLAKQQKCLLGQAECDMCIIHLSLVFLASTISSF